MTSSSHWSKAGLSTPPTQNDPTGPLPFAEHEWSALLRALCLQLSTHSVLRIRVLAFECWRNRKFAQCFDSPAAFGL
jgi:hypothetical protein